MKKSVLLLVSLCLLMALFATPALAQVPPLPHSFYGAVEINNNPAPIGTQVEARGEEVLIEIEANPIVTTEAGKYGGPGGLDPKLVVQGYIEDGTIITFYVNGESTEQSLLWHSGDVTELDLTVTMPTVPPTVTTASATGIGTTTATLNGTLTALGDASSVTVSFEWGTTTAYGNETTPRTMTATGAFSAALSGLSASTTYHFRAVAVGDGTGYGVDRAFTTATPPTPAAGGGGGGGPLLPAGTTNVRGMVSTAGLFYMSATANSEDGLCRLTIPAGTVGLTADLDPLTIITMLIMDDPPPPPEDAHVIGLFYDFQPSGATFEPPITLTFNYDPADIPEGIAEEDLVLAYYDQKAGEWVNLEGTVDTGRNTITVLISHFTAFTILGYEVVPEPPAFTPSSLLISPTEVDIDQTVNVSLSVANTGGMAGSYKVTLKIDDEVEATQQVTVGAGASETVTFTTSRDVAGSYSVDVNGLSGSFTVKEKPAPAPAPPPAPPEVKAPINWPVVGGIIAAVVVVGLVIFFLIRRRAY